MKRFLLFLLLIAACCFAYAAEKTPAPFSWQDAAKEATIEKFPDAASVLLYDVESVVYQADGTSVETDDFFQKVLTERGRRELRTVQLRYCTSYGTAKFLRAEVLRPGQPARVIDLEKYAAVTVDPEQMGENIYDPNWKIVKLSIPGLAVGDILHIVTERRTVKPRIPNVWCGYFVLQSIDPILRYEVRIDAPAALPLKSIAVKNEVPGAVTFRKTTDKDRIRYTWTAGNVPQVFPEPKMPAVYTCVQRLIVSTVPDWPTISRWYYKLCRPRMDAVSPAIREKVAELVKGTKKPEEKIRNIFRFVSQEIRYMGITTEETAPGYEPHDVRMTFDKRYGVCRDKAALLAAMLELAGLKAYPALFMAGDPKDPEIPNNYFNHAITAVERAPGDYILLDPTHENTTDFLPAGEAEMSYLAATPKGDTLRLSPPASPLENRLAVRTAGEARRNGLMQLRTELRFTGINDAIFRDALARWPQDTRQQYFAGRLKQVFPGARLTGLDVRPKEVRDTREPLSVTLDYTAPWSQPDDTQVILIPPNFLAAFGYASAEALDAIGLQKRQFPLKLFSCTDFMSEFRLKLPDGVVPEALPPPRQTFHSPAVAISQETAFADRTLTRIFRMQTLKTRLTPEDYAALKKQLRAWEPTADGWCFFRTDAPLVNAFAAFPEADAILSRHTLLELNSPHAGRLVVRNRILIANYAAVKRYSELQIPFNPVWDDRPKISGHVIAPDGRIRKLKPAEINVMDAQTAGQVPRYPAGKILAVSFPGVRPGSTVEYEFEQGFRDRPMIAYEHAFAGYEPLLSDTLEVRFAPEQKPPHIEDAPAGVEQRGTIFRRRNALPVPRESGQPDLAVFVPSWSFSGTTWEDYGKVLEKALNARTVNQPHAAAKARELCAKAATLEEKVIAIRNFVLKNIRQAGPNYTQLPLKCLSNADQTLADAAGNGADRAILMKTMLDAVGVPAKFVPVSSEEYTRENLLRREKRPDSDAFPHILVAADTEHPPYYLGGGTEYDALGTSPFENHIALNPTSGKLFALTVRQPARTRVEQFNIRLQEDGSASVLWTNRYYGPAFGHAAKMFAEFTPERRSRYEQQLVSGFSQNAILMRPLTAQFDRYPGTVLLEMSVADFAPQTGNLRQFELPDIGVLYQALKTAASDRKTPFERRQSQRIELEYRIMFPENWRPLLTPELRADQRHEQLSIRRRVRGNMLYVSVTLELRPCLTDVLDYDNLEKLQATAGKTDQRIVAFEILQKP